MGFGRPKRKSAPLDENALFDYAVKSLGSRMRTVRDLKRLMRMRVEEGESGERTVDAVVARLKDLRYLDDTRFANDYTRLRQENEKFGRRRVQQGLIQRGIHKDIITTTLSDAYDPIDEPTLLRQYIARKRIKEPTGDRETVQKQSARIMRALVRAGFSSTSIFKVLRQWNIDVNESDLQAEEQVEEQAFAEDAAEE
jgi:regulatory protein